MLRRDNIHGMYLRKYLRREMPDTKQAAIGICLLAIIAAVLPCAAQAPNGHGQDSQPHPHYPRREFHHEVEALEQQWRQAELKGDVSTVDRLLADDYMGITSNGLLMSREQTIERMRTREITFKRLDLSEVKVSVHGATAIVTSRAVIESSQNGVEHDGTFRYTRVYQRRGTEWKVVNFEATRISPGALGADTGEVPSPSTPAVQPR